MVTYFLIGLAVGLLLTAPLGLWWAGRAARRARALEGRTRQAERLAELGTLTGGLAHEIRNPLATLRLNLDLLAEELAQAGPADLDDLKRRALVKLKMLRGETQRLDDILEDFLRYAGQHELRLGRTDLNQVVRDLADFYGPQAAAARIRLRVGLTPDPLPVKLDADLFKQAVLNLLLNAQQAMAGRAAHLAADAPGELLIRTQRAGGRACLEVADTGPGIEPDRLERIFQAYYSTKQGGTGLGLPTARRIVGEHGGRIEVHSELGRGTSFTISLPLDEGGGRQG